MIEKVITTVLTIGAVASLGYLCYKDEKFAENLSDILYTTSTTAKEKKKEEKKAEEKVNLKNFQTWIENNKLYNPYDFSRCHSIKDALEFDKQIKEWYVEYQKSLGIHVSNVSWA